MMNKKMFTLFAASIIVIAIGMAVSAFVAGYVTMATDAPVFIKVLSWL